MKLIIDFFDFITANSLPVFLAIPIIYIVISLVNIGLLVFLPRSFANLIVLIPGGGAQLVALIDNDLNYSSFTKTLAWIGMILTMIPPVYIVFHWIYRFITGLFDFLNELIHFVFGVHVFTNIGLVVFIFFLISVLGTTCVYVVNDRR